MVTNGRQHPEPQTGASGDPAAQTHRSGGRAAAGDAAGHCSTTFFIPGMEADAVAAERFYGDLREAAEADLGGVAHKRRIFAIACRRQGADCTIEVGAPEAGDGRLVVAIFQLGRDAYTIHCRDPDDPASLRTIAISRRTVYSVVDFD